MTPNVSVCLVPEAPYPAFVARARELEAAGCANLWVYSNVLWRQRPQVDVAGALAALSAILSATGRIHAGLLVASPNLFHPVVLAKEILTLDELSAGRAEVVLGSGSTGSGDPATDAAIHTGALLSAGERAELFEDFVHAFSHAIAFSRDPAAGGWFGKHYSVNLHRISPSARENFVIGLAANGSRTVRIAAATAGRWVTSLPLNHEGNGDLVALRALCEKFDAAHTRHRPATTVTRTLFVPLDETTSQRSLTHWHALVAAVTQLGFDEIVVHYPRPHDPALPGPSAEVFSTLFPSPARSGGPDE